MRFHIIHLQSIYVSVFNLSVSNQYILNIPYLKSACLQSREMRTDLCIHGLIDKDACYIYICLYSCSVSFLMNPFLWRVSVSLLYNPGRRSTAYSSHSSTSKLSVTRTSAEDCLLKAKPDGGADSRMYAQA